MRIFLFAKAMGITNKEVLEKLEDGGFKGIESIQSNFPDNAYNLFETTEEVVTSILVNAESKRAKEKEEKEEIKKIEAEEMKEVIKDISMCIHNVKFKCNLGGNCPFPSREGLKPELNCNHAM